MLRFLLGFGSGAAGGLAPFAFIPTAPKSLILLIGVGAGMLHGIAVCASPRLRGWWRASWKLIKDRFAYLPRRM